MIHADYLIIGQGLAGSCLAMELMSRGKLVVVADAADPHSGSRVAAGLFNPVTSKVRQPTWMAQELFPFMDGYYRKLQKELKTDFYHPMPMYRPFPAAADRVGWEDSANPFVAAIRPAMHHGSFVRDPFGGIELSMAGYCDTSLFISSVRRLLVERGLLLVGNFDAGVLSEEEWPDLMGIRAKAVICCEGVAISRNPFFNWLPVVPLKGEVLEVEADLPSDMLFNRGAWLVPHRPAKDNCAFRAGSTYDHDVTPGNTIKGTASIRARLETLLAVPFRQTGAAWGLRPTVPDRRPVVGPHPERNELWCFNGLGTKGVTLAPWFAVHLANALEHGHPILGEANISRYYPLYFKSFQTT